MIHRRAIKLMVLAALMWSIAGVVTRHLDAARSFELTFWRSLFNALALIAALSIMRGASLWRGLVRARWPLWVSGVCWSVMFTALMVSLTLTTFASVFVTLAVGPLLSLRNHLTASALNSLIIVSRSAVWVRRHPQ